jgi:hypothetical protein
MATDGQSNTLTAFNFGAALVVVGLLGFTVSGGHPAAGATGGHLIGVFKVNVLHNLVHLAVGTLMIFAAVAGTRLAKTANVLVGAGYLVVGVAGLLVVGTRLNVLALNAADNAMHLALGLVLSAMGLLADR